MTDMTSTAFGNSATTGFSLTTLFARYRAYRDGVKTRNALAKLSDRELDDIGLTRGDIDYIGR